MSQLTVAFYRSFIPRVLETLGGVGVVVVRVARILIPAVIILMGSGRIAVADVHALFDLQAPATGPFPSDAFTMPDSSQMTELRVNLPMPDCSVYQSDCEDLAVINTLDGFNIDPQLSISFDGPIDVTTVTGDTVFLIGLDGTSCDDNGECNEIENPDGRTIGINQIVWDSQTNTLHVESDKYLRQHARYAVIVTRGVHDLLGQAVEATEDFRRFRQTVRGEYRRALIGAIHAARRIGVGESEIVTASVFTTQSITPVLEKIRDQINAGTPEPADFELGQGGARTVFPMSSVAGITWAAQTGDNPPTFTRVTLNTSLLGIIPNAVGTVAFGKYISPDFEVHPGEYIPPVGTKSGTPDVQGADEIYFNLFLPSGPKPVAGWPVVIFGHGNGQSKNLSFNVAATMAEHGLATIAINAVGHGFGRLGTLTVNQTGSQPVTFPAGGRSIDQNGDHIIGSNEGLASASPRTIIQVADGIRQTVADLMQLVRVIEVGVDVDGDGSTDLDPSRIYYLGHSLGGNYGTLFLGIEPSVQTGVLNSPGGPIIENRRISPAFRPSFGQLLASRIPSLINAPGITSLDGVAVGPPQFDENFPLRDGAALFVQLADGTSADIQSPVVNTLTGAIAIQQLVENAKWVENSGDVVAFAPYLRRSPLADMPSKSVLYQFGKGDRTVPNPNATAILRTGDLADRTTFYRHDLASMDTPSLPKDPHGFMVSTNLEVFKPISLAAQEQIGIFFESDGVLIIQPEPARYFEVPISPPLPEELNFVR